MASYLLQENSSRITLEEGGGYLILEDSVGPAEDSSGGHGGYLKSIEWVEDEDALAATLLLTL